MFIKYMNLKILMYLFTAFPLVQYIPYFFVHFDTSPPKFIILGCRVSLLVDFSMDIAKSIFDERWTLQFRILKPFFLLSSIAHFSFLLDCMPHVDILQNIWIFAGLVQKYTRVLASRWKCNIRAQFSIFKIYPWFSLYGRYDHIRIMTFHGYLSNAWR